MSKSIYPSIPAPGGNLETIVPTLTAMRQTLTMLILNAQSPNPNYTPSDAAQTFVTYGALQKMNLVGKQGPAGPQGPPGSGIDEAPNDVNVYGRHALGWQALTVAAGMNSLASPPASASTTYLMLGLGLTMSTLFTTRGWLTVSGTISNSTNNGETDLVLCYGAGTPPANGAALTGTLVGSPIRYIASTGGSSGPFSKSVLLTGLTPGMVYWFDLAMKAISGSASVSDLDIAAHGLL